MKIVIDTNIWISYLINRGNYGKLDQLIDDGQIEILFSNELLDEFLETARRPKFSKYFDEKDIQELYTLLTSQYGQIAVTAVVTVCRDIKDNFLLSLCTDGKADYLITGDKDLLDLKTFSTTNIITITDFLSLI